MEAQGTTLVEYIQSWGKKFSSVQERQRSHVERLQKRKLEHAQLLNTVRKCILEKLKVQEQARQNGLDTSPLDQQLSALNDEVKTHEAARAQIDLDLRREEPASPMAFGAAKEIAQHLQAEVNDNVIERETMQDLPSLLAIEKSDIRPNDSGIACEASVRFAGQVAAKIAIQTSPGRFVQDFVPDELAWLPFLTKAGQQVKNARNPEVAVVLRKDERIVIPVEFRKTKWIAEPTWNNKENGRSVEITTHGDRLPFVVASTILDAAMQKAGGVLDLHLTSQDPMLESLRQQIIGHTLAQSMWQPNCEWPSSPEILKDLEPDMLLLAAAPWADEIDGLWAKLKFAIENGDRPRFWRLNFANHFGFRLRTRDHSWITGRIFVQSDRDQSADVVRDGRIRFVQNPNLARWQEIGIIGRLVILPQKEN